MDVVAGSQNDEFYTPDYAILPLLKYLKKNRIVWCPFDTKESNFVKILVNEGFIVISTHLSNREDFFKICDNFKNKCDYIISNPPYSKKGEVIQKLFQINKPFAMLVGVVGLFESKERFKMFKENDFEIMYFDKRVSYFKDFQEQKPSLNPPFSSVYVCKDVLPKQIIFEELQKQDKKGKTKLEDTKMYQGALRNRNQEIQLPLAVNKKEDDGLPPTSKEVGIQKTRFI